MGDVSDWGEIIPMEQKRKAGMHSVGRNNLCGEKEEDRDASGRLKIIPMAQKSKMGMNPIGRNNPCGTEKQDRDESGWPK